VKRLRVPARRLRSSAKWSSNDWPAKWLKKAFTPRLRASVVIPAFDNEQILEAVLAGLAKQTYPNELVEVIVADDGSNPPLDPRLPDYPSVAIERQGDEGFRAGAARNLGAHKATGEVLVFLDSDMIPEREWLLEHMRLHHNCFWALGCGLRRHVDSRSITWSHVENADRVRDLFSGDEIRVPRFILDYWADHEDGRKDPSTVWRVTSSGNLSISAEAFWAVGGFDERICGWGGEDNDLGYRLYQRGAMVVPVHTAMAWHVGWGTYDSETIDESRRRTREILASRIPDKGLPTLDGIQPIVPELWIRLLADDREYSDLKYLAVSALSARISAVVSFEFSVTSPVMETARTVFAADSRIAVGGPDAGPDDWAYAPVVLQTADTAWESAQLDGIVRRVGEGALAQMTVHHESGSRSTATLSRVVEQVRVGLVEESEALRRFGHEHVSQRNLGTELLSLAIQDE